MCGASVPTTVGRREVWDVHGRPVVRKVEQVGFEVAEGPELRLRSGKVVVCGPEMLLGSSCRALARTLAPGSYATFAVIALLAEGPLTAMLGVRVRDMTAERWEPAEPAGNWWFRWWRRTGWPGLAADHGLGCIADEATRRSLREAQLDEWTEELDAQGPPVQELGREHGGVVTSVSGRGDGLYPIMWGMVGRVPVSLVVDFDVVDWGGVPPGVQVRNPWS